jgi:hydroxymethylpyrimidine/phosphomethylpyrimidine kinase
MDWGTSIAIKQTSKPPDLVYDTGSIGKEPMIRILGTHPQNVILKLKKIIEMYKKKK